MSLEIPLTVPLNKKNSYYSCFLMENVSVKPKGYPRTLFYLNCVFMVKIWGIAGDSDQFYSWGYSFILYIYSVHTHTYTDGRTNVYFNNIRK